MKLLLICDKTIAYLRTNFKKNLILNKNCIFKKINCKKRGKFCQFSVKQYLFTQPDAKKNLVIQNINDKKVLYFSTIPKKAQVLPIFCDIIAYVHN